MEFYDFFLEVGCEEIPSGFLQPMSLALKENIIRELTSAKLLNASHLDKNNNDNDHNEAIHLFATPRRLAISIKDLQSATFAEERKESGPPLNVAFDAAGNPTLAAIKFAEKNGISVESLEKDLSINKVVFTKKEASKNTTDLLPSIIEKALADLPIPKPMRWSDHTFTFARPVHWVTMIYNNTLVPATILGCQTVTHTFGHRVHHPESISLLNSQGALNSYIKTLQNAFVIADFNTRKELIRTKLYEEAAKINASPILIEELLDEVTGLVEWPVVLAIPFDERFLNLPREVLITSMQQHQKCFALTENISGENAKLVPYFLTVSNINSQDENQVVQGNRRVMESRLSDAEFFFQQDKKQPLESRREMTKSVVFQAKLGTLFDKSERLMRLTEYLASHYNADLKESTLAASLSQCDLMTDMVGEFPELQGTMGYYYALSDGLSNNVARALDEQYWPRFSGDKLPETLIGSLLAISERVDTLIGAFCINQKPTGNKDPFKLRRQALGLIRILIESYVINANSNNSELNLLDLLQFSFDFYVSHNISINPKTIEEAHAFILERLKAYYLDKGYTTFMIQAVLAQQSDELQDFDLRLQAIKEFSTWPEAIALSAANKRVSKILEGTSENKMSALHKISEALLLEPAEKNLVNALSTQQEKILPLLAQKEYTQALKSLATLREPVDAFFEQVMINVEDHNIRQNRFNILRELQQLFLSIANLSYLT